MKKTRRTARVGDLIRAELSEILRREIDDPALAWVSIVDVEVAVDLRLARVFVTVLGDDEKKSAALEALRTSKSRIRGLLGRRISLRSTPDLDFRLDTTAEYAEGIERILRKVAPHPAEELTGEESDGAEEGEEEPDEPGRE
jgi:ribosome-binding factor A